MVTASGPLAVSSGRHEAALARRFRRVVLLGSAGAAVVALAGLVGYLPGLGLLGSIRVDFVPMAPSTAASLLLLAAILVRQARAPMSGWSARLACTVLLLVSLFSLLVVIGTALGTTLTLEDRLFPSTPTVNGIPIGRMSVLTGAVFLAAGPGILAWLLGTGEARHARRLGDIASILGTAVVLAGGIILVAYLFDQPLLYGGTAVPMAATTALAFILLGVAMTAATGPESLPARLFVGGSTNAQMSRVLLPVMLVLVLIQGVVHELADIRDPLGHALGLVVPGVVAALLVAGVIRTVGRRLERADRTLRESEERFRSLVESANDAIFIWDTEGLRCLEANRAACERLGYTRAELLTMTVAQISAPEQAAVTPARAAEIAQRDSGVVETVHLARDGTRIPTEVSTTVAHLGGRRVFLSIARDITERKTAEAALQESERLYRSLFDHMLNGFAYCRMLFEPGRPLDFVYLAVNDAFVTQTGLQDVVGKRVSAVIPGIQESDPALLETYGRVARTGTPESFETYVAGLDMWFQVAVYSPAPEYFVAVFDVISARKAAEAEIRALNATLEARVAERTAELAAANEELESFSYSISHDLRAPLRAISGFTEILEQRYRDSIDAQGRRYLDMIVAASAEMGVLIEELLSYARLGREAVRMEPVALDLLVLQLRSTLGDRIEATGATLTVVEPLAVPVGDPVLLERILVNLTDNALTYQQPGVAPVLTLSATRHGKKVRLALADNGIGIPAASLDKIFEVFTRLHSADAYPGTGIGLAIARKAARLMGSDITVQSTEGEGSTFSLELGA